MVDEHSLRIGNYVYDADMAIQQLSADDLYRIAIGMQDASPIPITAKLLGKCGFYEHNQRLVFDFPSDLQGELRYYPSDNTVCIYEPVDCQIVGRDLNYLHEVQNAFYALAGSELPVDKL